MVLRRMRVMLDVLQDKVRPVDAPLDGTGHPVPASRSQPGRGGGRARARAHRRLRPPS
jgi:hypothetical protein